MAISALRFSDLQDEIGQMKQTLDKKNHLSPWKQERKTGKRNTKCHGPEAANQRQPSTGKQIHDLSCKSRSNDEKQK
jgi:hypothetical protein